MRFCKAALAGVEDALAALLMALLTGLVFVAVVSRYAFDNPIGWSDEVAKISFTWLVFLGGAIGVRRGAHISIDAVVVFLPPAVRLSVAFVADLLVLAILGVFVYFGSFLMAMTASVPTPSLELPVALVYAAAPLGAFLMLLHHIDHIASTYFGRRTSSAQSREEGR